MTKRKAVESRGRDLRDIKLQPATPCLPALPTTTAPAERRNVAVRNALTRRIRSEFEEMPGLSLTLLQAMRLFGVSADIAARIFRGLAEEGVLHLAGHGRYGFDHEHP